MSRLGDELNPNYVNSVLQYGAKIEEMITKLEQKGEEFAKVIKSLEELEGTAEVKADLRLLIKCPMVPVLNAIKKNNARLTGEEVLPDFYPQLVEEYIKKHPDDAAILQPLCIAHQHIRKSFGKIHGWKIQQVACRSGATGKVVYSKKGLEEAGLIQEQAEKELGEYACLFTCKQKAA